MVDEVDVAVNLANVVGVVDDVLQAGEDLAEDGLQGLHVKVAGVNHATEDAELGRLILSEAESGLGGGLEVAAAEACCFVEEAVDVVDVVDPGDDGVDDILLVDSLRELGGRSGEGGANEGEETGGDERNLHGACCGCLGDVFRRYSRRCVCVCVCGIDGSDESCRSC